MDIFGGVVSESIYILSDKSYGLEEVGLFREECYSKNVSKCKIALKKKKRKTSM